MGRYCTQSPSNAVFVDCTPNTSRTRGGHDISSILEALRQRISPLPALSVPRCGLDGDENKCRTSSIVLRSPASFSRVCLAQIVSQTPFAIAKKRISGSSPAEHVLLSKLCERRRPRRHRHAVLRSKFSYTQAPVVSLEFILFNLRSEVEPEPCNITNSRPSFSVHR